MLHVLSPRLAYNTRPAGRREGGKREDSAQNINPIGNDWSRCLTCGRGASLATAVTLWAAPTTCLCRQSLDVAVHTHTQCAAQGAHTDKTQAVHGLFPPACVLSCLYMPTWALPCPATLDGPMLAHTLRTMVVTVTVTHLPGRRATQARLKA